MIHLVSLGPLEAVRAKWEEKRCGNATPCVGRRVHEVVDMQAIRKEQVYSDVFQEGEGVPLDEWLESEGFASKVHLPDNVKVRFVEKVFWLYTTAVGIGYRL